MVNSSPRADLDGGAGTIPGRSILKAQGAKFTKFALALSLLVLLAPGVEAKSTQKQLAEGQAVISTEQKPNGHRWVKARILIRANPHVVWETVHEERKKDPDLEYSKILSESHNQKTLEQKFAVIPIFGTATCVMNNQEVPLERIDYNMISSDRFKAMEGSWVLTPGCEPGSTYLELSTYADIGLPIPRPMIEGVTGKKLQRRLANVKLMAESTQTRLAQSTHPAEK